MNKFYKLVIVLLPIGLMAQPTIDDSWQPAVGDAFDLTMTDGTFTFPTAGANQTWDYSNLNLGATSTASFVDPSTTPYASDFPNSNLALYDATASSYLFYETSTTEFSDWGLANAQTNVIYSDPLVYMSFPISYGDNVSDNATGTIANGMGTRTTTGTLEGYGYGDLILPNGTVNNVLCVKFVQDVTDDYGGGTTTNSTTESYLFVSPNETYTILSLNEVVQSGQSTKYGLAKANYVGLENELNSRDISTKVFPNPINKGEEFNLNIEIQETKNVNINVLDITGKKVKTIGSRLLTSGSNDLNVDSDGLETGIYFVNISSGDHSSTVKIIVK